MGKQLEREELRGFRQRLGYFCGMAETILDRTPTEAHAAIDQWVAAHALPKYRTAQIVRRLWIAPVGSWNEATELPGSIREALAAVPITGSA